MCKILTFAGIKDEFRDNTIKFIYKMADQMSDYKNKDGLGYAAIDKHGNLFGERWHVNQQAFNSRDPLSELDNKMLLKYKGLIYKEEKYNSFGNINLDEVSAITLHTRFATSGKEFYNTHPFVDEEKQISLIHNGVISNVDDLVQKQSTCDSECILNEYIDWDVSNTPNNIQGVAESLEGYYACGVLGKTKKGKVYLDIFKSSAANLHAAFIKELDTMVFSTDINDIEAACRFLNFTIESKYECLYGVLLRVNAITGDHITSVEFNPGYSKHTKYKGSNVTRPIEEKRQLHCVTHEEVKNKSSVISKNTEEFNKFTKDLQDVDGYVYNSSTGVWSKRN